VRALLTPTDCDFDLGPSLAGRAARFGLTAHARDFLLQARPRSCGGTAGSRQFRCLESMATPFNEHMEGSEEAWWRVTRTLLLNIYRTGMPAYEHISSTAVEMTTMHPHLPCVKQPAATHLAPNSNHPPPSLIHARARASSCSSNLSMVSGHSHRSRCYATTLSADAASTARSLQAISSNQDTKLRFLPIHFNLFLKPSVEHPSNLLSLAIYVSFGMQLKLGRTNSSSWR
jgi:hypothetical protein